MDPITAIGLAIGVIKAGIEIYRLIHDHPNTLPEIKVRMAGAIESHTAMVKQLEDARSEWEKRNDIQAA